MSAQHSCLPVYSFCTPLSTYTTDEVGLEALYAGFMVGWDGQEYIRHLPPRLWYNWVIKPSSQIIKFIYSYLINLFLFCNFVSIFIFIILHVLFALPLTTRSMALPVRGCSLVMQWTGTQCSVSFRWGGGGTWPMSW